MIASAILLSALIAAVVLAILLPQGTLPGDHAPDDPPITWREMDDAADALDDLERGEGRP